MPRGLSIAYTEVLLGEKYNAVKTPAENQTPFYTLHKVAKLIVPLTRDGTYLGLLDEVKKTDPTYRVFRMRLLGACYDNDLMSPDEKLLDATALAMVFLHMED